MSLIPQLIEWVANDLGHTAATLLPYGLLGLTGLYFLWLVLGYLRVSQVGIETAQAPALRPPRTEGSAPHQRLGVGAHGAHIGDHDPAAIRPRLEAGEEGEARGLQYRGG